MNNQINHLSLSWSVSKGANTYGYNICRLDDRNNGKRFRCLGGGYDMIGTVFGEWLQHYYQSELLKIKDGDFYGMTYRADKNHVTLDGACGIDSMMRIAEAIGLEVERDYIATGRRRGETIGWFIQMKGE